MAIQTIAEDAKMLHKAKEKAKNRQYKSAINLYNRILKAKGEDALIYYNRAIMKSKIGDIEGAVTDCKKSIQLDPHNNAAAHYLKAFTKESMEDLKNGGKPAKKVFELVKTYGNFF